MDVVAPIVSTPISCKDMLTGSTHLHPSENIVDLDDDGIELLDDDVIIGLFDGVPTIDFSDRVYDRGDYLKVLTEGPWTIFGHYITVEPWSTDFNPLQASASRVMAWVRLSGLPATLFKGSFIEPIGNQIGSVIKMDFQTDNGCRVGLHVWRSVSTSDICSKLHARDDPEPMQKENDVQSSPIHDNPAPADPFHPWMLVELNMPISLQSYPRNLLLAPTPLSSHPPAVSVLQQDTLPVVPSGPLPTATKATGNHHANSIVSMQDARRTEATSSKVLRPRGISKSSTKSLLDRLKHQVVQHADGNHPSIPIAASCRRELKGWPCSHG
ncbi:hypothetical protein V6N12_013701 [Hibiscus sabdariffa]|uniref:DUF4283 domain-containing protein n=1 Tax=Hibiscus sabdariffa TaxID=183260 RepID=A0ABR2CV10_9ROSI